MKKTLRAAVCILTVAVVLLAALPASDNFDRADSANLGSNWTTQTNEQTIGITSNVASNKASPQPGGNFWNADTFADDQLSEATMTKIGAGADLQLEIRTRCQGAAESYYAGGRNDFINPNDRHRIWKIVGGTRTGLATQNVAWVVNDKVKLENVGTGLELFVNDVSELTTTDSSFSSGSAGIGLRSTGGVDEVQLDDWTGDDISTARRFMYIGASLSTVHAQAEVGRFYILPVVIETEAGEETRVAKYSADLCALKCAMMDFGGEDVMLVVGLMDSTRHSAVSANPDVLSLPENLDQNLPAGAVTVAQTFLEARNIPAGWLNTTFTHRRVLRRVAAMFQFAQRYQGITGNAKIFTTGVDLSTRWNQLPIRVRQNLKAAGDSMNFDTGNLSGTSTLRQILREMGQQWGNRKITLGGVTL